MTKKTYYPEVENNPNFPAIEKKILELWKNNQTFEKSIEGRNGKSDFIFYDGPPFANGLPHYGHLLTGFVKDIVARYQTMRGKKVERRFGWDCHGLPAEMEAEKELKISGRNQIVEFGIEKFNKTCRSSVMKYTSEWHKYVTRQARWVDFKNDYKTMDLSYMESVLWAFRALHDKGLIYQSMRVMPYSWACETPLSNFETRLDNSYRERADKAVTVAFELLEKPNFVKEDCDGYKIMAWTTTPWTLPSNLALAVGPEIEYTYIIRDRICYILGGFAVKKYAQESDINPGIIVLGKELYSLKYKPIFDFFAKQKNAFQILTAGFVVAGDGTGCVHIAPGFGEEDHALCNENHIDLVCPVDNAGKFTSEVPKYQNMLVFDANDEIIKDLKIQNSWIKTEQYLHNYPHCWRTDTPLIYKAVPSWYVSVTKIKDRMVELNQQINWIPGHIRDGLFGKWLENARDWSISRNRFWGTPIPVWQSDDPKYPRIDVYGSIAELEKDFGVKVEDLHKPFIDELVRPNPDDPTGKSMMRRVGDVFDCWFESGSMPYAQLHYPFENKEHFEKNFPADFIVEYTAQTRGWFYTLMVLSTALFDRPPFLNCICHGVILDGGGQKLSKRLRNYADPLEIFEIYGADALRYLMASSPVLKGQELLIDKDGVMVKDKLRLSIKPIWNAYNFFTLYANSDGILAKYRVDSSNLMDQYILSKLKNSVNIVREAMDSYDISSACIQIDRFFEILNNWYIRRNRNRFWKSDRDQDKVDSYDTLYTVLEVMCRVAAPLLPLVTEEIYRGINFSNLRQDDSVHLLDFPDMKDISENSQLMEQMDKVQEICSVALSIRNERNIRVRQPLAKMNIYGKNLNILKAYIELIKDEVNVKDVEFSNDIDGVASHKLKINFPILGKRLPNRVKDIISASKQNLWQIVGDGSVEVAGEILEQEEFELNLEPQNKENSQALIGNDAVISLDLKISEDLYDEGIARDLIRALQQSRKDANLCISDHVQILLEASEALQNIFVKFKNYIEEQTLSELIFKSEDEYRFVASHDFENERVNIYIK